MPDITMPQLGETVTEGTIIKWFKQVGDQVAQDEVLFEVSTDKVDSEVPSSAAGYLAEILVPEGETVDVGARLAVISEQPVGEAGGESGGSEPDDGERAEEPAAGADDQSSDGQPADGQPAEGRPPDRQSGADGDQAAAKRQPADAAPASADAGPTGPSPRPQAEPAAASAAAKADESGAKLFSPVVRRLISENDLDPAQIEGTGQEGRITRADVLAFLDKAGGNGGRARAPKQAKAKPAQAEAPAAAAPARSAAAVKAPKAGDDDEVVPFSNIRRRTAEHMVRSKATSAHVLTVTEVDFDAVDQVRRAAGRDFKAEEGFSLTYLPFVARAVVEAIADFPHANASVGDDELIVHRRINLGFAVDISFEGLIVPVLHDADGLRLVAIARGVADLARRARARGLSADDISGGTFTITNPGPFGTFITAPVINQPQVAILSTDGVKKRPVVVELPNGEDAIAIHPVGNLALSFDHRAFDGAYAAAFLGRCKQILETQDWAQEL